MVCAVEVCGSIEGRVLGYVSRVQYSSTHRGRRTGCEEAKAWGFDRAAAEATRSAKREKLDK